MEPLSAAHAFAAHGGGECSASADFLTTRGPVPTVLGVSSPELAPIIDTFLTGSMQGNNERCGSGVRSDRVMLRTFVNSRFNSSMSIA
jgi:hypothetical protein